MLLICDFHFLHFEQSVIGGSLRSLLSNSSNTTKSAGKRLGTATCERDIKVDHTEAELSCVLQPHAVE
jgi:hypothetical protein